MGMMTLTAVAMITTTTMVDKLRTGSDQRLACHVCSLRGALRGVSHDFRSECLSCVAAKKRNVFHTIAFLFFKNS